MANVDDNITNANNLKNLTYCTSSAIGSFTVSDFEPAEAVTVICHVPVVKPRDLGVHDHTVLPVSSVICFGKEREVPFLVKLIWHEMVGVVEHIESMLSDILGV
jgi:hypothetical protein